MVVLIGVEFESYKPNKYTRKVFMSYVVICENDIWESYSYINLCSICSIKTECNVYVEIKKVSSCDNYKCLHNSKLVE